MTFLRTTFPDHALAFGVIQATIEIDGTIPRQNLVGIGLVRAFALADLLGPALHGGLAVFRRHGCGIDEFLRKRRLHEAAGDER